MPVQLSFEYSYTVFIAGVGVLQAAAAYNSLKGLLFYPGKGYAYLFSALAIIPALYNFFTWNSYNATGVIEGGQQAVLFAASILAAIIATLFISSLINYRLRSSDIHREGLETLREISFFTALKNGSIYAKHSRR